MGVTLHMPTVERTPGFKDMSHLATATHSSSPHSAMSSREAFTGRHGLSAQLRNLNEVAAGISTHPTGLVPLCAHPHPALALPALQPAHLLKERPPSLQGSIHPSATWPLPATSPASLGPPPPAACHCHLNCLVGVSGARCYRTS